MAKNCEKCGKKLPLLSTGLICKDCRDISWNEKEIVKKEIVSSKRVSDFNLSSLKKLIKGDALDLYEKVYMAFESDNELDEQEIETLNKIQELTGLSHQEVKYTERIQPYLYVLAMKEEGKLPTPKIDFGSDVGHIILKKNENIHFAEFVKAKEKRSVSLGYRGGSHGVSFKVAKGVRYRVGAHRGHIERQEQVLETSRGFLLVTNQRIFLHPVPGNKPIAIPLNKIQSYQCFQNGLEVYKEGREKGYFFEMTNSGAVEIFGLCLNYLLSQNE